MLFRKLWLVGLFDEGGRFNWVFNHASCCLTTPFVVKLSKRLIKKSSKAVFNWSLLTIPLKYREYLIFNRKTDIIKTTPSFDLFHLTPPTL